MKYDEKIIKSEYIYKGKILNLRKDIIKLPNNKEALREIVEHRGGVCCLAKTKNNEIIFVKQFRSPYQEFLLELPAGKVELGEKPDQTIIRELHEEAGVIVKEIKKVGIMYPSPGFTNEIIHLYYTDNFELDDTYSLDEDEFLDMIKIKIDDVYQMVDRGEIVDAKTLILLLKYKEILINRGGK